MPRRQIEPPQVHEEGAQKAVKLRADRQVGQLGLLHSRARPAEEGASAFIVALRSQGVAAQSQGPDEMRLGSFAYEPGHGLRALRPLARARGIAW